MAEQQQPFFSHVSGEQGFDLLEDLVAVAQSGAAFSEPLTVGERTVITAAEVSSGLGYGYGMGADATPGEPAEPEEGQSSGYGGGGGGGFSMARPVAVISVGPEGVRVEPIVDVTKLGLAFLTLLGSMLMTWRKMRR